MFRDRMQASRYELKYLISETKAQRVRDFVLSYLNIDEYGVGQPDYSYSVHSLYLDSDDLQIYWRTINGDKNRYKLRLRYYSEKPGTPVFFEVKRRMKDIIQKQRGGVRHEAVPRLLAGHFPEPGDLISQNPAHLVALQRFIRLMMDVNASPRAHIYYKREAYVSDDDEVRVTMDREVLTEPNLSGRIKTGMAEPVHSYAGFVILELKFTNRFPVWFSDLVRMADTMQTGAAKYVSGITQIGPRRLRARVAVVPQESVPQAVRTGFERPPRYEKIPARPHPGPEPAKSDAEAEKYFADGSLSLPSPA
jgi:hypothetical protein